MAISTPVSLASVFTTSAANDTPVTASVTFTSGRLYLFTFEIDRNTPPDLSTGYTFTHGATDRTASWNFIRTQLFGTPRAMAVYWYVPVVTETVTLTYDAPGSGANSHAYSLVEIASGFNSTTPIVQSNGANATGAGSVSVTLGAAPTTGNLLMSFVGSRAASGAVTPRTNWTELSEVVGTGTTGSSGGLEVQYVFDPNLETTASATPASGTRTWGIIAIEIAAASSGVTGSGSPSTSLSASASGTGSEAIIGSGTPALRISASASGVGVDAVIGSGSPVHTLSVSTSGAGVEVIIGTGAPTKSLSVSASGTGLEVILGTGAPARTLSASGSGAGTVTGGEEPPQPERRGGGFKRILYDPAGAQEEIDARPEWSPDDLPFEAKPLPGLEPLPERPTPTQEIRLPKHPGKRGAEATVVIVDDEDEIDFILNIVLDLD